MAAFALPAKDASAGLAEDFREILFAQVSKEVKDKSLVADIVEIRFRREFDKWKGVTPITKDTSISHFKIVNFLDEDYKKLNQRNFGSSDTIYLSAGKRITLGYSKYINHSFKFRTDISGISDENNSNIINGNQYKVSQSDYSLGSYIDYYPFQSNFRISVGLNLNRIQHIVTSQPNTAITINGKTAQAGSNYIDITYKFPKVTPFIGIGYETGTGNDFGWNGVAELGVMVGKYNTEAKTNLLGQNAINLEDLNAELNTNKSTLFNSKYQPIAKIGLKYGY